MPTLQLPEILLIALILILLFGVGKIAKIGGELGSGIKAFRDGLSGKHDTKIDVEKKEDDNEETK